MTDPLTIIAAHCFPKPPECFVPSEDAELRALGIDAIQAACLSMAIEDATGARFEDAEVFGWRTVGDVLASVRSRA